MSEPLNLDRPLDPEGFAYTSMRGDGRFLYAVVCDGRRHYTNSKKRWKKHYRAASKRKLAGTWFKWDTMFNQYAWWRIRLSEGAL